MRKLRVAIIGQGRSGYGIHGEYFASENNDVVEVVAAADLLEARREMAQARYHCPVFADYKEFFKMDGIDLVVNATFSKDHYGITKDLLEHGFSVLVEKPFAETEAQCRELMALAKARGLLLAVFQQSLFSPDFLKVQQIIEGGKLGEIVEIAIRYAGFSRRWDWQTLQSFCAGSLYNTGPHPIGQALSLLHWDDAASLIYSKLAATITSGDAEDYAKLLLSAPHRPMVEIDLTATDAFGAPRFKVQGTYGTLQLSGKEWQMKYLDPKALEARPVCKESLMDEHGAPIYCSEKLPWIEESGLIEGSAFDCGTHRFYQMVAKAIFEGAELEISPEYAARTIRVIEEAHRKNPLPIEF